VNAICPGLTDTERVAFMAAGLAPAGTSAEEYHARMLKRQSETNPLGRPALAEDISRMAAFLASSDSDYVTGVAITVAGGSVTD
jgi:NAD(P)-dependent dehydrogenase (short-subunit alcohol dehydrogenase family)